jgi:hypothetical protein
MLRERSVCRAHCLEQSACVSSIGNPNLPRAVDIAVELLKSGSVSSSSLEGFLREKTNGESYITSGLT